MPYFSHTKLRKEFTRLKLRNSYAKLIGLDIGRKYIGVAISDTDAKLAVVRFVGHTLSLSKHSKFCQLGTHSVGMISEHIGISTPSLEV